MLPIQDCDKISCLEKLVGIRSLPCPDGNCPDFSLDQLEGVDIDYLAKLAKGSQLSGEEVGKDLIRNSAKEMMGDIEMMLASGFQLLPTIGELCSTCEYSSFYVPGTGIKVTNNSLTGYGLLRITSVKIKANATGEYNLKIDDGVEPKLFPVVLEAGTIMPVILNYSTTQKFARVSLEDEAVGLAQVNCPTSSSCGCGGGSNPAKNLITYSGQVAEMDSSIQYGFIVCANISCSYDILVCDLVRQTPNVFALTLLYKAGERLNTGGKLSLRNNRVKAQGVEVKEEEMFKYNGLYRKRMQGSTTEIGIRGIVKEYLKNRKGDTCIQCDTIRKVGYATG